ncbi:Ig-like domain-containing protein [Bradyrhizobium sp. NP1]|uniref:Ig-like domain-containing protein n=1 Tax=Bradyrhizobium sp. NP1 TaxID=3049772 RepID=UPI0025A50546|nr:Ig-like domain-containing protein [Bradyrhizobium sp. NP1]WJR77825.1 Ig-like domain-containing protein [Bradyrhizobium sp. NP1]
MSDADLLFHADFTRSGVDLVLSKDGRELVLHDYFKGEKRAPLASSDGAHLAGDLVNALTGQTQYAQADPSATAGKVIGHVTKLAGGATVVRNGVSIILHLGDNVEKGDIVQTNADSSVGITFIDGTVFGLSSNARMVLNEMVYDPNGSGNSTLFSLVSGTISFVAGETAKHGDMKIDTPVATMGIRGTAVLVQIDFDVSTSVNGAPATPTASFQVLVEPDGTTGNYVLLDKLTLQPIATVNAAGTEVKIINGIVSTGLASLTPDAQKLITDVFQQKFADLTNPVTKTASTTSGSSTPPDTTHTGNPQSKDGSTTTTTTTTTTVKSTTTPQGAPTDPNARDPVAPDATAIGGTTTELTLTTASSTPDTASGSVSYADPNAGDQPTVSIAFDSFTYTDGTGQPIANLNDLQKADIKATEVKLVVTQDPAAKNHGTATWSYKIADHAFDFLAAGETLTLTYEATVDNGFTQDPTTEFTKIKFTIVVTGTNDTPVITTDKQIQLIEFTAGTATVGGTLQSSNNLVTAGTFAFTDPDLTDTHTVARLLTGATLTLADGRTLNLAQLDQLYQSPMDTFAQALYVAINQGDDSTGSGTGTITWKLNDLPVYLADFIEPGQTLTLIYTVTLTDSQGATDTKTVEVTITGNNNPAVVWIHTTDDQSPDGSWTTKSNWGTGNIPTGSDDVIIITNQLQPHTPSYPATVTDGTQAVANSVTMNDFAGLAPELDIQSGASLAIGANLNLSADSILHNAGTVTVGGKIELKDSSALANSGALKLGQGGDIRGGAVVTNDNASGAQPITGDTLLVGTAGAGSNDLGVAIKGGSVLTVDGKTITFSTSQTNITSDAHGNYTVGIGIGSLLKVSDLLAIIDAITGATVPSSVSAAGQLVLSTGAAPNLIISGAGNVLAALGLNVSVTNTGLIELQGGTLNVLTNIANAQGDTSGQINVDAGATLVLDANPNGITGGITGGTVTIDGTLDLQGTSFLSGGTLINYGQVNVSGTETFDHETVTNNGTNGAIDITGALTLKNGASISNGAAGNTETVEGSASLTLQDTSFISGGTIINKGTLNLQGTSGLKNGKLTNTGAVNVAGVDAFDQETVTNNGVNGAIDITGALTLKNGASIINGAAGNTETVEGSASLTLQDTSFISGGTIINKGALNLQGTSGLKNGTLTNTGAVKIAGVDAFDQETVTNNGVNGAIDITGALTLKNGASISNGAATNTETVEGSASLTLQDATSISGGTIINKGTLNLQGTSGLKNGTLTNTGAVKVAGVDALDQETVTNNGVNGAIDITGALTLKNGASISNGAATNTETVEGSASLTLQDGSSITGGTLSNAGTVFIETTGAALHGVNVINTGTIQVDVGGGSPPPPPTTLTVDGGTTVTGGNVTVGGTGILDSTAGTNTITDAIVNNSGIIEATGGKLTINQTASGKTITNSGTLEANGGELDITGEPVANTGTLAATKNSTLKLTSTTVTNTGNGKVTVASGSLLNLVGASILGGSLTNSGSVKNVSGASTVSAAVTNNTNATIEVVAGSLNLSGGLSGAGLLQIDDGTLLELAGATSALAVLFAGGSGTGTLQLDNSLGFTGTISATAAASGNFIIDGKGGVVTGSGDGIDFTSSGGSAAKPATVTVDPAGTITGAVNGVLVVQNGVGDITVTPSGTVTGQNGDGIIAEIGASGSGNIIAGSGGMVIGQGAGSVGLFAENFNPNDAGNITITQTGGASGGHDGIKAITLGSGNITIEAGGVITAGVQFGIRAEDHGTGHVSVQTDDGTTINSGGTGISAVNLDDRVAASFNSTVTVTARGTINSGTTNNPSGSVPAGINAGYFGSAGVANTGINGTVSVDNFANITAAAGYGINAFNWGVGNVTVHEEANTSITAAQTGIAAFSLSGGKGDVTITVDQGVTVSTVSPTPTSNSSYGVQAFSQGPGKITVTTSNGDTINSGSSGIVATDGATTLDASAGSTITVTARGIINSGANLNTSGSTPAGILAGYTGNNGGNAVADPSVHGAVLVDNFATITAAAGFGINAFNGGQGNITVHNETGASVTGVNVGIRAVELSGAAGDISITNDGTTSGQTGVLASTNGVGGISVTNTGQITGTTNVGLRVAQDGAGVNGSSTITNSGHIAGGIFNSVQFAAISIAENATGTAKIDNTGTIGASSASVAIVETGGGVTINNNPDGVINGSITVANATFSNEVGATWNAGGASQFGASAYTGATPTSIDNDGTINLSAASISSVSGLTIDNSGTIDALSGTSAITGAGITNTGTIEATGTGTLQLNSTTVTNAVTVGDVTTDGLVSVAAGSTLVLSGSGIDGGKITSLGTVEIAGDSSITNDAFANHQLTVDSGKTLKLNGTTVTGGFVTGTSISATLAIDDGKTLKLSGVSINGGTINNGSVAGTGSIDIIGSSAIGNATLNKGGVTIESGQTLTLTGDTINGTTITFAGTGDTLKLDATSAANFHGTISGLVTGDFIDLMGVTVSTAVWNGSTLVINGTGTTYQISSLPSGDTFAFKSDGQGGTLLEVLPETLTVGSSPATGVETTAVPLHFSDALTGGATLTAFVISGIPANAVLSDGTHTQTVTGGTLDVAGWNLANLTITPTNDSNFVLSAMVTSTDPNGFHYTVPATETVTVNPTSPSLTWAASVSSTEAVISLAALSETITGQTGDSNVGNTLTISGVPQGAVLSDGHGHSAIGNGTAIDVSAWTLSSLTIDTTGASVPTGNFTLTATATEKDAEGNVSAATSVSEQVIVNPTAPTLTWAASASGTETVISLGTLSETITSHTGDGNVSDTLTINGVPQGAVLSDGHGHSAIGNGAAIDVSAWTLSSLTIDTSGASVPAGNFTLTATATEKDAEGNVSASTSASEQVTIDPAAPTVAPVTVSTVEGAAVALNLGIAATNLEGDGNTLNAVTLTFTVPANDTYTFTNGSGLNQTFAAGANQTLTLTPAQLAGLSITTTNASNVSLTVSATQIDAEGDVSHTAAGTEIVTVNPTAPTVAPVAVSGVEGAPIALNLGIAPTNQAGDSNTLNAVTLTFTVPANASFTFTNGSGLNQTFTAGANQTLTLTPAQLAGLSITTATAGAIALAVSATEVDTDGNVSQAAIGSETVTVNPSQNYLWGTAVIPEPGNHTFNPIGNFNIAVGTGALLFGTSPSSGFNPSGPDVVTESAVLFDSFVLPYRSGIQTVQSSTTQLPFKYQTIAPATASGPEALVFYSTETNGVSTIYQQIISEPNGPNGSLILGSATALESNVGGQLISLYDGYTTINPDLTTSPTMTSYEIAWANFNPSTGAYQENFQIFSPTGTSLSPVVTIQSGSATASTIPAWQFRNAGSLNVSGVAVPYAAVIAVADPTNPHLTDVRFQGYNADGTANSHINFLLKPDLTAFPTATASTITAPSTGASLLYTPNGTLNSGFSAAWSETVTDATGNHSQVEFVMFRGSGQLISHTTFQVPDAQNIRVGSFNNNGNSAEYLVYGDNNSTTIVEFDQNGHQIASVTDTAHHGVTYGDFEVLGDGRVALTYPDPAQYTTDIFDLRQAGLSNPTLSTTSANYVAGTHFADTVTGASGVNNFYDFVGSATGTPTDTFTGGATNSFNEAVFTDGLSNFTLTVNGTTASIVSNDSAHGGTLNTSNVQALLFGATSDPAPSATGGLEVTAHETLVMLGNFQGGNSYPVTIDATGTLEIAAANSFEQATFNGAGTLQLDQSQSYHGMISGFAAGSAIDLKDIHYSSNVTDIWNAANNTLTISDGTHTTTLFIAGSGYTQDSFALQQDGGTGTKLVIGTEAHDVTLAANQVAFHENSATTIATSVLSENDAENDTDLLVTAVGGTSAHGGNVSLNGGIITYTPAANFTGSDSFTYTLIDDGLTSTATASFKVAPAAVGFDGHTVASGSIATTNVGNGSDGVTLDGWVNWNGHGVAGEPQLLFYNGSTSDAGLGVNGQVTSDGLLDLQIQNGGIGGIDTHVKIAANQWHDVALTHVNGVFDLYVDGALAYSGSGSVNNVPGPSHYPDHMMIGGVVSDEDGTSFSTEGFKGSISNVSVWNTALSASQIQSTDFSALTGSEAGLAAYYKLNDGSGSTVLDLVNGAGNLTLSNADAWHAPPANSVGTPTFTTLDFAGDANTQAIGINDAGVVVGQADASPTHQVGWSYNNGIFTSIVATNSNDAQDTSGHDVNNAGTIVGDYSPVRSTPRYGFTDNAGSFTQLTSDSPGASTNANGINDAGVIVGSDYLHSGTRYSGYIYSDGSFTYFSAPGAANPLGDTFANGINNEGQIVGSFNPNAGNANGYQGYLDDHGTFTTISDPLGVNGTHAQGINDFGQIVGFYTDANGVQHGFLDSGGTFITLDDPLGVNGTVVNGINNLGEVVGYYLDGNNASHGFEASLNGFTAHLNQPLTLTNLSVSDAEAGNDPIEVTLSVHHGSLNLANTAGLTVGGLGTGSVSLTGSQSAIDNALAGGVTYATNLTSIGSDALTITTNDQGHNSSGVAQTTTEQVALTVDGPVIETDQFQVSGGQNGPATITGLKVIDPDAGANDIFTVTATTQQAASGSTISPGAGSGHLSDINAELASITYNPGATPPQQDAVSFTVTDSHGASDTVNFIFNQGGGNGPVTLTGTSGNDVIIGSNNGDTLTGNGGQDQFVFKPASGGSVQHTITDFNTALDTIDVRQFASIASLSNITTTQQGTDTLVTLDANDSILLKHVTATNLHASDFIFHT